MIISVTERGIFKRCRRMWDYSSYSRQALEPVVNRPALVLGQLIHQTLADWMIEPNMEADRRYMQYVSAALEDIKARYRERIGANISEEELGETYEQVQLGLAMIKNYVAYWGTSLPEGYRLVQPEQTCLVPIPYTWHFECSNKDCNHMWMPGERSAPRCPICDEDPKTGEQNKHIWLEGTLDALVADPSDAVWVLERKTYMNRPNIDKLAQEDQFLAYCWLLEQLNIGKVGGILYDGMWKRDVGPKRPIEDLFLRQTLLRGDYEIAHFGEQLAREALDMIRPSIYPNRRWEGCYDCSFERLCTTETRGEDVDYIKSSFYKSRPSDRRIAYTESD